MASISFFDKNIQENISPGFSPGIFPWLKAPRRGIFPLSVEKHLWRWGRGKTESLGARTMGKAQVRRWDLRENQQVQPRKMQVRRWGQGRGCRKSAEVSGGSRPLRSAMPVCQGGFLEMIRLGGCLLSCLKAGAKACGAALGPEGNKRQ